MKPYDVIVVGAGAAGLLAAYRSAMSGNSVLLIEKMERPARKLLITGKGRCNITNLSPVSEHLKHIFPDSRFLKNAYYSFFAKDIIALLEENGVKTVTERGNRVFPVSEKSADVVNALLKLIQQHGVELLTNCKAKKILIRDGKVDGLLVEYQQKTSEFRCKKLILCTGGKSYPATGSTGDGYTLASQAGHAIVEPLPALVPLETEEDTPMQMQGLALKNVTASLWVNDRKVTGEFGEMLFTHFGLSGPIILTLSRKVVDELRKNSSVKIIVDLKPALDDMQLDKRLIRDLEANAKKQLKHIFKLWLPSSMIPVFLSQLQIDELQTGSEVRTELRKKIRLLMKNFQFTIKNHRPFSEAVITAGGVSCDEVDPKTMQSKLLEGLYFAGEILNLDADTGGYNLQIAWTTGWVAGSGERFKTKAMP